MSELKIIPKSPVKTPIVDTKSADEPVSNDTKNTNTGKYVLGGLAALGVIGAVVIAIKNKNSSKIKAEIKQEIKTETSNVEELVKLTINKFKECGNKFTKGKAIKQNGEMFTGSIIKQTKKGMEYTLEYKDGILQSSAKSKDGKNLFNKLYTYNDKNQLIEVKKTFEGNSEKLFEKIFTEDGKLILKNNYGSVYIKDLKSNKLLMNKNNSGYTNYYYGKDGKLKYELVGGTPEASITDQFNVYDKSGKKLYSSSDNIVISDMNSANHYITNRVRDSFPDNSDITQLFLTNKGEEIVNFQKNRWAVSNKKGKAWLTHLNIIDEKCKFGKIKVNNIYNSDSAEVYVPKLAGGFTYNQKTNTIKPSEKISESTAKEIIQYINEYKKLLFKEYKKMSIPGDLRQAVKEKTHFI